jgi:hypothetical protein
MHRFLCLVLVSILLLVTAGTALAAPTQVSQQGRLLSPLDDALLSGGSVGLELAVDGVFLSPCHTLPRGTCPD